MHLWRHLMIELMRWRSQAASRVLAHRVLYRNPTLTSHHSVVWDYGYADIDAIEIGKHVSVGVGAHIIVYKRNQHSSLEGRLKLGNYAAIQAGVRILASSGAVHIGANSTIAQNSVVVAANHKIDPGRTYLYNAMDETRTGVWLGENVWVGANCVLLPGARIGDNSVIAAGAVVRGEVPANEIWAGVPAKKLKAIAALVE